MIPIPASNEPGGLYAHLAAAARAISFVDFSGVVDLEIA